LTASLSAQITREQADNIVYEHIQNKMAHACYLYINENVKDESFFTITTEQAEVFTIHYPCWIYCVNEWLNEDKPYPSFLYFFVSKNCGKLLEVKTKNDSGPDDLTEWQILTSVKIENTSPDNIHSIKIYDLTGKQVFYASFPLNKNVYESGISFLLKGTYIFSLLNKDGKITNYKIIKR
jgi:hypothetical protein